MRLTWTTITSAAGALGLIVAVMTNMDALAERFPFPTKGQVVKLIGGAAESVIDLQWAVTVDRLNRLQFEIGQQQLQALQLSDEVDADPTDRLRRSILDGLRIEIGNKQKTIENLRCQIEAHDADATC